MNYKLKGMFSMNKKPKVALIMGSDSDYDVMKPAISFLKENDMLTNDAIVVKEADVEMGKDDYFSSYRHYRYGMIHVNIYWR